MDRIQQLKAMIDRNPEEAFPLYGLAMEHKKREQYDEAVAVFDRLLRSHPEYTAAYFHYGMSLRGSGNEAQAVEIFKKGIEITQSRDETHAREELQAALAELQTD